MATCRSCGERIYWSRTKAGSMMPLNPQPQLGGNVEYEPETQLALVVRADKKVKRHMVHYVTCVEAKRERAAKRVRLKTVAP